uniref:Uncharacterized protein n=1 Tax=Octactis speculum TaxID=3111310 RepID=A0A7S2FAC3_9STRA
MDTPYGIITSSDNALLLHLLTLNIAIAMVLTGAANLKMLDGYWLPSVRVVHEIQWFRSLRSWVFILSDAVGAFIGPLLLTLVTATPGDAAVAMTSRTWLEFSVITGIGLCVSSFFV